MKQLLMVNNSLSNGGSERVMVMLANELVDRGYKIDMLLCSSEQADTYTTDRRVNLYRFYGKELYGVGFVYAWFSFIRKHLRTKHYDVAISFLRNHNVLTLLAARNTKCRVIVSERNNPFAIKKKLDVFRLGEQILYPKAFNVVFQTEDIRRLYKHSIYKRSNVIPNPVNPNILEPIAVDLREKYIVTAGRLHKQKNYPMLIRAFERFSKKYPTYKLLICGRGALENELKSLVKDLEIIDKVQFMGFIDNVDEIIRRASMFVLASDYEGISNAMIEALAMGVPTICTDCPVGGARMMIHSGENGILVPVGDESMLFEAMCKVIENPDYAMRLGQKAVKIKEMYSINKIADMWEEIICDMEDTFE